MYQEIENQKPPKPKKTALRPNRFRGFSHHCDTSMHVGASVGVLVPVLEMQLSTNAPGKAVGDKPSA